MSASINISLPDSLRTWIDEQVAEGGYESAEAFVQATLREVRGSRFRDLVDAKLLEALDSGDATPMTEADWNRLKDNARQRWAERNRQ